MILSVSIYFEFLKLRFCASFTRLKQDVMYSVTYAALHTLAWQICKVWCLFIYFISLPSCFCGNDKYQSSKECHLKSPAKYIFLLLVLLFSIFVYQLIYALSIPFSFKSRLQVKIKSIEYCSSLLSSNKIIDFVEWVEIENCFIDKNS